MSLPLTQAPSTHAMNSPLPNSVPRMRFATQGIPFLLARQPNAHAKSETKLKPAVRLIFAGMFSMQCLPDASLRISARKSGSRFILSVDTLLVAQYQEEISSAYNQLLI